MAKKIVDILPPKQLEKKEVLPEKERKVWLKKPKLKISLPPLKKPLFFIPLVLILVFLFCYFTLSKAKIEIWPETETLTFKSKLTVDEKVEESNFSAKIIPGKIFEEERTISESFPSSGKILKEEKAEGIIRVYNAHSTSPQVLVATTRFISVEGKLFRSLERVTIPGGYYEKGKLVPGFLDIKVRADQSGPEYNIGPSTFSLPGFAGTPRYTTFYGKSFQPMQGGLREEVPQLLQKDLDQAKDILVKRAESECLNALQNKISPEFNLIEKAVETKILEILPLAQAGQEIENFLFQVKVKGKALVFKSKDIEDFTIDFISAQIPNDKKLYRESLKMNYLLDYDPPTALLAEGKIILPIEFSAKIFRDIVEISLKKGISGKSLKETQIFLANQPQITKIKVELWPFWVKKIPEDIKKIEIKLNLD